MKSIFLLGSATIAAGATLHAIVDIYKAETEIVEDANAVHSTTGRTGFPIGSGCDEGQDITTEEDCYAAALALRRTNELGAEAGNKVFPYPETNHPNGWSQMVKGCVVWTSGTGGWEYVHFNTGSAAGTAAPTSMWLESTHTLCMREPIDKIDNRLFAAAKNVAGTHTLGNDCHSRGYAAIHTVDECLAAAKEGQVDHSDHGASIPDFGDTVEERNDITVPEGCLLYTDTIGTKLVLNTGTSAGGCASDNTCVLEYTHAICSSGQYIWSAPPMTLADASCDALSQEYRDDTCCTNCVA